MKTLRIRHSSEGYHVPTLLAGLGGHPSATNRFDPHLSSRGSARQPLTANQSRPPASVRLPSLLLSVAATRRPPRLFARARAAYPRIQYVNRLPRWPAASGGRATSWRRSAARGGLWRASCPGRGGRMAASGAAGVSSRSVRGGVDLMSLAETAIEATRDRVRRGPTGGVGMGLVPPAGRLGVATAAMCPSLRAAWRSDHCERFTWPSSSRVWAGSPPVGIASVPLGQSVWEGSARCDSSYVHTHTYVCVCRTQRRAVEWADQAVRV